MGQKRRQNAITAPSIEGSETEWSFRMSNWLERETNRYWMNETALAYAERKQKAAEVFAATGIIYPWMRHALAVQDLPNSVPDPS